MNTFGAGVAVFEHHAAGSSINIATPEIRNYNLCFMVCPFCSHDIAAEWQPLTLTTDELGRPTNQHRPHIDTKVPRGKGRGSIEYVESIRVALQWLRCQNVECREIVVQVVRTEGSTTQVWLAVPKRRANPKLNDLILDPFRKDYLEAYAILEDSPRMSAVLSRRLLADLLEKYAGLKQFSLAQRIDAFVSNAHHPHWIRENLHYLREMGDFGAHKQEDKNATLIPTPIIEVDAQEAEWTLRVVSDLFEYFIVAPQKDKEMRTAFDKKMADAGRRPIPPLKS